LIDSIRFDSIRFDSTRFDSIRFDSTRFDSIRSDSIDPTDGSMGRRCHHRELSKRRKAQSETTIRSTFLHSSPTHPGGASAAHAFDTAMVLVVVVVVAVVVAVVVVVVVCFSPPRHGDAAGDGETVSLRGRFAQSLELVRA